MWLDQFPPPLVAGIRYWHCISQGITLSFQSQERLGCSNDNTFNVKGNTSKAFKVFSFLVSLETRMSHTLWHTNPFTVSKTGIKNVALFYLPLLQPALLSLLGLHLWPLILPPPAPLPTPPPPLPQVSIRRSLKYQTPRQTSSNVLVCMCAPTWNLFFPFLLYLFLD